MPPKKSKKYAFSGAKRPSSNPKKDLEKFNGKIAQFYQQNNIQEALLVAQQALKQFPNNLSLLNNAGGFAAMLGQTETAKQYMLKTLKINPNYANTHNNIANLFKKQQQWAEADKHYQQAIEINPNYAEAHYNFANLLKEQERVVEAQKHYQTTIRLNPNHVEAHGNLATLLKEQENFDEAEQLYRQALDIDSSYMYAHYNLGILFQKKSQLIKAKEHYRRALSINSKHIGTKWALSILQLTFIEFGEGWQNYESRYHENKENDKIVPPRLPAPKYQSGNLIDKHLLIVPEQGIGDEIMFASVLPELQGQGAQITLACDPRLDNLFNRSFDFLTAIPKDPDNRYQTLEDTIDYWLFIGSLPKFYRNDIKDFDKHKPYLKVDDALLAKWQDRLAQLPYTTNIGIAWAGGKNAEQQKDRSLTLEQLTPILEKASQQANIINLQYGDHTQAIEQLSAQTGITIHDWEDADPLKDLDNFAAQISALDLVISIDNSTVHFSGALGVQTLVMLPFNQDWRWGEDRDDSYWYPKVMKLFRQPTDGDWDSVIHKVVGHLNSISNH